MTACSDTREARLDEYERLIEKLSVSRRIVLNVRVRVL
jgi:hypothetical protein